ncbi:hypothetical protein [Streptomyces sp. NPDC093109]|uniref:hypothetical protein n=1 Tax=Streptomyces sp. NPDC093109 TaxID=3154977 RepID=UPI00345016CF
MNVAAADFSPALPTPAHPLANPGYGKRSAPEQLPRGEADFAHLCPREAAIATYIDRLPEGSAIGYKALAANIAAYGQQACSSSLRRLSNAGHLRLIKEHLVLADSSFRWVTRTYFSRTARDDAWWKTFVTGLCGVDVTEREREQQRERERLREVPDVGREDVDASEEALPAAPAAAPAAPATPAGSPPARSLAYLTLAQLGRADARMTLSAAECAALEGLAAAWLDRGASPDLLTVALTSGLPSPLHSPAAIARKRLETKMPPEPVSARTLAAQATAAAARTVRVDRVVMMCVGCDNDETTAKLIRGVCVDCRTEMDAEDGVADGTADGTADGVSDESDPTGPCPVGATRTLVDTARRAAEIRAAAGLKTRKGKRDRK